MTTLDEQRRVFDALAAECSDAELRASFDALDAFADRHGPILRQLYLALYRRLHG